jgi:hypothetical protein
LRIEEGKVLSFLGASENIVFVSAMVLMLLIGVIQLVGLGDHFGHDADVHLHVDGDLDFLAWLGFGQLPLLLLLVVFLTIFGTGGLLVERLWLDLYGDLLTPWIAVPAVAVGALPVTGLAARGLARVLPRDHTTAVPLDALVGGRAQIVTGRAAWGSPARARAEDDHGQAHYVMVEPNESGVVFEEGEIVLLIRREADIFRAISRGDFHLPRLEG